MKKVFTFLAFLCSLTIARGQTTTLDGPAGSGNFGANITILTNGNYVIADPLWDNGSVLDVGAVYLYDGVTHTLISTLTGTSPKDQIGSSGVTALDNGNFVVRSNTWDNGSIANAGAATWGSGTVGVSGTVNSSNSLVGNTENDQVSNWGVVALPGGNYVVISTNWSNGSATMAGAVTFCNGDTGFYGSINSSNSLVGGTANDRVGYNGVTVLANGNYVVASSVWNNGSVSGVGAVTWCNGLSGRTGIVSSSNSLVGSTGTDQVGKNGITVLPNGNYVVSSLDWNNVSAVKAGAVTWCDGSAGTIGVVSSANSLVGSRPNDQVGFNGIKVLSNGNYVVMSSYYWDNGTLLNAGAVTWGSGTSGVAGIVSESNSLVGGTTNDQIGVNGITILTNGNFVVMSRYFDNGSFEDAGAATWVNGATGRKGVVSSSNSLVGSKAFDAVGQNVKALTTGNYVVHSPLWDNGANGNVGAVTWCDGNTGRTGVVSSINSLTGNITGDQVGNNVVPLANGNYAVVSYYWDNGSIVDAGAVTWCSGITGRTGVVAAANSLVGSSANDNIGINGLVALTNGNYVIISSKWDNGTFTDVGAITWVDGAAEFSGVVNSTNSLLGSTAADQAGSGGILSLSNGNYVAISPNWDNGSAIDAGAVTWANGSTGVTGVLSRENSLVGSKASDKVGGNGVLSLVNGNYVVSSPAWDNGSVVDAGAVTWGDGTIGVKGAVTTDNSLVGSKAADQVGSASGIKVLSTGDYVVSSPFWDNSTVLNAGAITWGRSSNGVSGVITACNSVTGLVAGSNLTSFHNTVFGYLIVGKQTEKKVAIFDVSVQPLAIHLDNLEQIVAGYTTFINTSCRLICSITSAGANPVSGNVATKVWIESIQPASYVRRHFKITPASYPETTSGKVTLYFTQQEFDDFNAVNSSKLPSNSGDVTGIANILIEKRSGISGDGSGLPGSYTGESVLINPDDTDIVWNKSSRRWEISFEVMGFSGFFVKTSSFPLPVRWISTNAHRNDDQAVVLNWKVNETNVSRYEVERSIDAKTFRFLAAVTAFGNGIGHYSYIDRETDMRTVYYRIKELDSDGTYSYSRILSLSGQERTRLTAFPNPANDHVIILLGPAYIGSQLKVVNSAGIVLQQISVTEQSLTVPLDRYASGTYLLHTFDGSVVKLVKQ